MKFTVEITKDQRANDLSSEFESINDAIIFISQNASADDGYRIISWDQKNGTIREGSKAVVRCYCELSDDENTYDTLEEANTAIAALETSDGYDLIDLEQPVGSAPSIVIANRPSLWARHHESYSASKENNHSRTDADRY